MKTVATFGVRCAAIFVVVSLVMTMVSIIAIIPTVSAAGPASVNLGTAGDFVILSKSGISTTGTTLITGDIGVSPIDHTALTGFSETIDASNQYSISAYVVGKLYAADYTDPTPAKMTTAVGDMQTAYTDAAGRTLPDATELGAGDISTMTIAPGLYKWGTGVHIDNRGVTLSGAANDVWIFQISQDLTVDNAAIVTLGGAAQAKNIFWQVGGGTGVTLGTTSVFNGNILAIKAIVVKTGATLNGRALAQTAVTLDANAVTVPTTGQSGSPLPISTVNPISHYWKNTSPQTITATGSANSNYIKLFYRYAANNATWGAWTEFGNDTASPWSWSFTFTNGTGNYQFYSRAYHNTTSFEAAPAVADRICGYDNTAPTSSVNAMAPYWKIASPMAVTAISADALSGVKNVTLYYRYAADNTTWGVWTSFGLDITVPWNWTFTFPSGNGYYQFYSRAYDNVTDFEAAPAVADQICGYDTIAPTSSVDAMAPYWKNTSPQTVTGTAADATSGVKSVALYYRYAADNTTWGAWTSFGIDLAAPWSWSVTSSNGTGYYQIYTRATDKAGIVEAAPAAADLRYAYDNVKPVIGTDTTPITAVTGTTLTFNIAITDNIGVTEAKVVYRFGTGAWVNQTMALSGTYQYALAIPSTSTLAVEYYAYAADAGGNWQITSTKTVVVHPTTSPTVIILGPATGLVTKDLKVAVHGTADATLGTVAKIEWALDNATWAACTGTTAWNCNISIVAGSNKVTIRATDNWGNKGFKEVTLNLDSTVPTLTITGLKDNSTVKNAKLPISGTATDTSGIAKVEVRVNGGTWQTVTGTTAWSYNATLKNGKNIIDVRTTDKAGNVVVKTDTVTYKKASAPAIPGFEAVVFIAAAFIVVAIVGGKRRN